MSVFYFRHLDSHKLLIEDFEAHAVWRFDELLALLLACDELDVCALLLIFACLPLYRVVPLLEQPLFEVVLRSCAQRRVHLDIRGEPARLLESKHPMNIN